MIDIESMDYRDYKSAMDKAMHDAKQLLGDLTNARTTTKSKDGMVAVTVGPLGQVVGVEIRPGSFRRTDESRLAATITATMHEAMAGASKSFYDMAKPAFGPLTTA